MCFFCDSNTNTEETPVNKVEQEEPRFNFSDLFTTPNNGERAQVPNKSEGNKPSIDDILLNDDVLRQFLDEQNSDPISVASALIDEQFESPLDAPDINSLIQYIDSGSDRIQLLSAVPLQNTMSLSNTSSQQNVMPVFKSTMPAVGDKRTHIQLDNTEKREAKKQKQEQPLSDDEDEPKGKRSKSDKKKRLVWTTELHNLFVQSVTQLGLNNAAPKTILQLMNVKGLTTEHIKSHLQKYRLSLKKTPGDDEIVVPTPIPVQQSQPTPQPPTPLDFASNMKQSSQEPLSSMLLANMLKTQFGPDVSFTPEQYNFLMMGATLGYKLGLKEGIQLGMPAPVATPAFTPMTTAQPTNMSMNFALSNSNMNVPMGLFQNQGQSFY